jgi:pyruvate dehydrogenase E2 component (dihydrolipoamide acetyltransferase)
MSQEFLLPDIGDVAEVEVIEIPVAVGDSVDKDDTLIVLETDKATMDIPAPGNVSIKDIKVAIGDKVSQGDLIMMLEAAAAEPSVADEPSVDKEPSAQNEPSAKKEPSTQSSQATEEKSSEPAATAQSKTIDILVPDIGDIASAEIIEICVSEGDEVAKEQSVIVLETDKATVDIPASEAGTIATLGVSIGQKISQGDLIGTMKVISSAPSTAVSNTNKPAVQSAQVDTAATNSKSSKKAPVPDVPVKPARTGKVHASPVIRRLAREYGVDLTKVSGSGRKNRILKEDVQKYVKYELSRPKATATTGAFAMPEMPKIDHTKWGPTETVSLSRIQKISSVNLHRNWVTIPHVTQHEEADITELEAFRKSMKADAETQGVRLTPLAFVLKAVVASLKAFPTFNASLGDDGETLILKQYYHVGVAVDTPNGLVVPVIRDVDQKSVYQLAQDLAETSKKAREGKLGVDGMQGGCFTISSLGGIGGTSFTPIVNWPDVAILGLSKNQMKPVWNGSEFVPRLMLPMSLSYDHRVIDGALAARFAVDLAKNMQDIRRLLL